MWNGIRGRSRRCCSASWKGPAGPKTASKTRVDEGDEGAAAEEGTIEPFTGETSLFILPGYRFRAADLLMTNFHLPRSTLFMLVCAFAGTETMSAAYAHAIATGYRFYSYGDASLLWRHDR